MCLKADVKTKMRRERDGRLKNKNCAEDARIDGFLFHILCEVHFREQKTQTITTPLEFDRPKRIEKEMQHTQ